MANRAPVDTSVRPQTWAHDLDVFNVDAQAFALLGPEAVLYSASDGAVSGATITSAGADFVNDGIIEGDVVQWDDATEGEVLMRIEAVTATTLTVARLGSPGVAGQSLATDTGQTITIKTFGRWLWVAQYEIGVNRLRLDDPNEALTSDVTDDYDQLWRSQTMSMCSIMYALHLFYESLARGDDESAYARKAQRYMERFQEFWATAQAFLKETGSDTPTQRINPSVIRMKRV